MGNVGSLCFKCKEVKPLVNKSWCRECKSIAVKENAAKKKESVLYYLNSHPCVDCGEDDPVVLEFDHIGKKKDNLSDLIQYASMSRIWKEIQQCEVRCANCHKRKTAREQDWYKNKQEGE